MIMNNTVNFCINLHDISRKCHMRSCGRVVFEYIATYSRITRMTCECYNFDPGSSVLHQCIVHMAMHDMCVSNQQSLETDMCIRATVATHTW